ncbi:MAG TPA: hypothetical protein VL989_03765, partial [Candidatus Sulfotelmatobacter sp.]|nr:hypothetical protein [Candidatus Sulfotelmatobacter sp.]
ESLRAKATAGRGRALAEAGWDTKGLSTRLNPRTLFNRNARNANIAAMREARMGVLGAKGLEGLSVWENNKSNDNTLLAHVDGDFAQQKLRKAQADAADESKTEEERADARTQISTWQQAISAASLLPQDNASKLAAAQRLFATGYQMEDGEEGYNRMASIVAKYTGNTLHWEKDEEGNSHIHGVEPGTNNGAYVNNMNLAQFSEKNAGRFDLAGLNNGQKFDLKEGLDKAPPYVLGTQAKPTVFKAAPKEYMGKDIGNEVNEIKAPSVIGKEEYDKKIQTAMTNLREAIESGKAQPERLIEWHDKLMSARGGAQGSNLDQMNTQIDVIRRAAGIDANGNVVQPAPGVAQDATQLRFTQGIKSNMDRYRALPPEGAINDAANQQGGGGNQGGNV